MSFETSQQRSKNYFKQVKGSALFKILSIGISFLLIPMMIHYLGEEKYGIWSTILSMVSWMLLFDIGIGNGLRNKITHSLAKKNSKKAQSYISTSYVLIGAICLFIFSLLSLLSFFIPWQSVFNTTILSNSEIRTVINITITLISLNFFFSLIDQVFYGIQKSSLAILNKFSANLLTLILVALLYLYTTASLTYLVIAYGIGVVASNIIISIWFYRKHIDLVPKITLFKKKLIKPLTSLGFKFFIIQVACVVMLTTDKILITQLFGPKYVTDYDVVFKLFSIITVLHGLLMAPLWSAYSDAYHREDFNWIKKTIKTQLKIFTLFILAIIILIFLTPTILHFWIGSECIVSNNLILTVAVFVLILLWGNLFAFVANGTNRLNVQLCTATIGLFMNIPLSIFIVKYFNTGVYGILIGTIFSLSLFAIAGPIQIYKDLKRKTSSLPHDNPGC